MRHGFTRPGFTRLGFTRLGLTFGMAAMAFGLATAGAKAEEIIIAVAGPFSGPVATVGEQFKHGAQAGVEAVNAAGGVNGKMIKLQVEDDVCDPKQAVAVANRLAGLHVKFVDGHACSGSSIPASEVYAENNILMMTPSSSNPLLTEQAFTHKWSTIMRLYGRDDAQGQFIGPWIAEKFKGKKMVILHDKSAYGQGLASAVKAGINASGAKEVLFDSITPGEKDYSAVVSKLKALGAEFVYFGGYHPEAGLILRQSADQGFKFTMMMGDAIATPEFWQISGPAGEGTLFTFPSDPQARPTAAKAVADIKKTGFQPEGFTLFAYAVIQTMVEGMKRTGGEDPVKIAAALRSGPPVNTVVGPVSFDEKGDLKDTTYDVNVWHDGKYAKLQ
jgi:branched-chain amino acid transport system substrate-binding protein